MLEREARAIERWDYPEDDDPITTALLVDDLYFSALHDYLRSKMLLDLDDPVDQAEVLLGWMDIDIEMAPLGAVRWHVWMGGVPLPLVRLALGRGS